MMLITNINQVVPEAFLCYRFGMGQPQKNNVILYRAVCLVTGKSYVGVTERTLAARRREHINCAQHGRHPFAQAIRKHGAENFRWEVVQTFMFAEDALKAEMALIAELKRSNTYNYTDGGPGQNGRPLSEEARRRIGESKRGNAFNLGKKRSAETLVLMRKAGLAQRKQWLKRSHLGPEASAKSVVCLDDGKVYASASAAAIAYGQCKSIIIEVCNRNPRRRTAGGLVFRYDGDHHGGKDEANAERALRLDNRRKHSRTLVKAVRCIDDGRVFPSLKEASQAYGLSRSFISEVCRGEKASKSYRFEYVEGGDVSQTSR